MKIIVGLGNPGKKYETTRHNAGFLALDRIMNMELGIKNGDKIQFKMENKFEAETAVFKIGNEDIVLVKPQTFMNLSGKSVKKIVDFYKLKPEGDLIVIHDDIDIELGKIKIKNDGSSAGHRGVQSIIDELGTERFIRVRVGVGRPENQDIEIEDWVLMPFGKENLEKLEDTFDSFIKKGMLYLQM